MPENPIPRFRTEPFRGGSAGRHDQDELGIHCLKEPFRQELAVRRGFGNQDIGAKGGFALT